MHELAPLMLVLERSSKSSVGAIGAIWYFFNKRLVTECFQRLKFVFLPHLPHRQPTRTYFDKEKFA
jgi:hypothetical protein